MEFAGLGAQRRRLGDRVEHAIRRVLDACQRSIESGGQPVRV